MNNLVSSRKHQKNPENVLYSTQVIFPFHTLHFDLLDVFFGENHTLHIYRQQKLKKTGQILLGQKSLQLDSLKRNPCYQNFLFNFVTIKEKQFHAENN